MPPHLWTLWTREGRKEASPGTGDLTAAMWLVSVLDGPGLAGWNLLPACHCQAEQSVDHTAAGLGQGQNIASDTACGLREPACKTSSPARAL